VRADVRGDGASREVGYRQSAPRTLSRCRLSRVAFIAAISLPLPSVPMPNGATPQVGQK
jgi:hypothetical protein